MNRDSVSNGPAPMKKGITSSQIGSMNFPTAVFGSGNIGTINMGQNQGAAWNLGGSILGTAHVGQGASTNPALPQNWALQNVSPNQSVVLGPAQGKVATQPGLKPSLVTSKTNLLGSAGSTFLTGVVPNQPRESTFKPRAELPMQLEEPAPKLPTIEAKPNKQSMSQIRRKDSLNKSVSSQKLKTSVMADKTDGGASKRQIKMKKMKSERAQRDRAGNSALPDLNKKKLDLNSLLLNSIRKTRDIRVSLFCDKAQRGQQDETGRVQTERLRDAGGDE